MQGVLIQENNLNIKPTLDRLLLKFTPALIWIKDLQGWNAKV